MPAEKIDQAFATAQSATEMHAAYAAAYTMLKKLIRAEGENKIWKILADRRYSVQP